MKNLLHHAKFGRYEGYLPFAAPHPYSAPLYAVLWPRMLSHADYLYRAPVTFGFQFLAFQLNLVTGSLEKWEGGRRVKSGHSFPASLSVRSRTGCSLTEAAPL